MFLSCTNMPLVGEVGWNKKIIMNAINITDNLHKFHKLVPDVDKNHHEQVV